MEINYIVIDTNVIISALIFSKSTTMQALREAKQNGVILISVEILSPAEGTARGVTTIPFFQER